MKLRFSFLVGCAALLLVSVSSKGQSSISPYTQGSQPPTRDNIPGENTDVDPHRYDDPPNQVLAGRFFARAEYMSSAVVKALDLSPDQGQQIDKITTQENVDLAALGMGPAKAAELRVRERAREQIRALLTADQRAKFNLIPGRWGGGLVGKTPWEQLDRLDKIVHLTPSQKEPIFQKLVAGTEDLMENQAPERVAQAEQIRLTMGTEIRTLLTPDQQKLLDAAVARHREKSGSAGTS